MFILILDILRLPTFFILDISFVNCTYVSWTILNYRDEVENKPSLPKVVFGNPYSLLFAGISIGMHPGNERLRYIVMTSPIGWAHT